MGFDDLSPELQEKVKACETAEEFEALCSKEGIKLSDEEIDSLAGGDRHCQEFRCGRVSGPRCQTACGMHYNPCPDAKR